MLDTHSSLLCSTFWPRNDEKLLCIHFRVYSHQPARPVQAHARNLHKNYSLAQHKVQCITKVSTWRLFYFLMLKCCWYVQRLVTIWSTSWVRSFFLFYFRCLWSLFMRISILKCRVSLTSIAKYPFGQLSCLQWRELSLIIKPESDMKTRRWRITEKQWTEYYLRCFDHSLEHRG